MLRASLRKIKSAPKKFAAGLLLALAGLGCTVLIVLGAAGKLTRDGPILNSAILGKQTFWLEPVTSRAGLEKGLSDRKSMPADHGMLFVFDSQGQQCFWMKDMRFDLDIIWTDSTKKVTAVEPDLTPSSFPRTYCHIGRYVIEVHAGVAAANHVTVGRQLSF